MRAMTLYRISNGKVRDFTVLTEGLDRLTSLEIISNTAYIVTLGGEIWKLDNIAGPPFGRPLNSRAVIPTP